MVVKAQAAARSETLEIRQLYNESRPGVADEAPLLVPGTEGHTSDASTRRFADDGLTIDSNYHVELEPQCAAFRRRGAEF